MSTFDELPHHEARSAAYDGEPVDDLDGAVDPVADAAWAAAWRAVGDELREVATPVDLLDELRGRVLDEVAPHRAPIRPARPPAWRRALAERAVPVLGAAAALVLVVVGIGALAGTSGDDGSASTAFEADSAAVVAGTGSTGSTGASGTGAAGTRATAAAGAAAPVVRELGAHDTVASLAAAWRGESAPAKSTDASSTTAAAASSPTSCGTVLATAILAGRPVLVVEDRAGAGAVVVDPAGCAVVATLP